MLIDEDLKKRRTIKTIEFIAREDGTALDSMSGLTLLDYIEHGNVISISC